MNCEVFIQYLVFKFNMHSQTHSLYKYFYICSFLVAYVFSIVLLQVLHKYHHHHNHLILTLHIIYSLLLLSLIPFFLPLNVLQSIVFLSSFKTSNQTQPQVFGLVIADLQDPHPYLYKILHPLVVSLIPQHFLDNPMSINTLLVHVP